MRTPTASTRPAATSDDARAPVRRRDVQGLRAVAVAMVVLFHAGLPLPGGFTGVDVFFVISGFVITGMLTREVARTGRLDLARFYGRRFKRLTPALALVVVVTLLASILLLAPFGTQQVAAKTGLGAVLLVANGVIATSSGGYFDPAAGTNPLLHTWSLSVEEQFYLVFPVLLLVATTLARRRRVRHRTATAATIGVVAATSFALMLVGPGRLPHLPWLLGYYSPVPRAWEFAVGALLAVLAHRVPLRPSSGTVLAGAGVAGLVASCLLIRSTTTFPGWWTVLPVAAAGALLAAGATEGPVTRLLSTTPFVKVGDWSYSIYLWHWPCIVLARTVWPGHAWVLVAAAAFSVLPALASYRFVEQPVRTRPLRARVVVAVLAPALVVGPLVSLGAREGWGIDRVQEAAASSASGHLGYDACLDLATSGGAAAPGGAACRFGADATGAPIALVGDSNAAQYSEAVVGAGRTSDRPVTVRTAAACPFFDVYRGTESDGVVRRDAGDEACRRYYVDTLRAITTGPRGTVVIAESASQWLLPDRSIGLTADDGTSAPDGRARALETGLERTVRGLQDAGQQVVLVLPMFWLGETSTPITLSACPTMIGVLAGTCPGSVALSSMSTRQSQVRAAVRRVAQRTGSATVDVLDRQCPGEVCTSTAGGIPVYADSAHLSAQISASLAGRFAAAIGPRSTTMAG